MIIRREACFLVLVVVLESVFALLCPTNCTCEQNNDPAIWIYCPMEDDPMVTIKIEPGQSIDVICGDSLNMSHFPLTGMILTKDETIKSMNYMCQLPRNNSLGEIAQILGATHVEKLSILLAMVTTSTPIRRFLCDFENLKYLIIYMNELFSLSICYEYVDQINWMQNNCTDRKLHLINGYFKCTPGLERLELYMNKPELLEMGMFDNLKNLTWLSLSNGYLSKFQSGIFDELDALETLNLRHNGIDKLPEDIFAKLENIDLSENNHIYIPKKLLQNNRKLHTVDLSYNGIRTLPNDFFANLTKLQSVSLCWNSFITLPEDLFWGCTSLTNINLEGNSLQTLPVHIFRDLKELKELKLNSNKIETLPDYIFANTKQLMRLDLSSNLITFISEHLLNGLYSLEELNMEANQLMTIAINGFSSLKKLKIAMLSQNHLSSEYVNNRTFYTHCEALEELYLHHNNISEIFFDRIIEQSQLRKLDLTYNNITSIIIDFLNMRIMSNNVQVDLSSNKIKYIFLRNVKKFVNYLHDTHTHANILVGNNPLHCDCQLYNFLRYIEGRIHYEVQNYFHIILGSLTCQSPKELVNVHITDLRSKLSTCEIGELSECPKKCNCLERLQNSEFIFDCSQRNLTSVPSDIKKPDDYTQFDLNFSGNRLTRMPDLKAMKLQSVKNLILSHNSIIEISLTGLSSTIEVLELHNNNLSRIHPDVLDILKQLTNLTQLTLHENPWICDCDAKEFQNFIRNPAKNVMIPDLINVKCVGTNISVSEMTDFCTMNMTTIIGISIAISLIGILIGFFGLYYKYERRIKVWLFAHQWCLWFVTEEELDTEKLYDAFVSYSHKDHDFVVSELVPELENGSTPFKLCLHFRDWVVGEWIPANIISSVENSRRTIVVLSLNFLESVWGRLEFRAAHSQALNEGRARVILILYGDIGPIDNLDSELKAYMNMNTYVTWGDPWFWDKLKYALPHQPKLVRHSADRNIISEYHQLSIQTNGDQGCQN